MSWRKHFTTVSKDNSNGSLSPLSSTHALSKPGPASSNYSSYLPDVYIGSPNRIERYGHYNVMDLDSEVNASLDILAEFCTQKNKQNNTCFSFTFNREATNSEITILSQYLKQWYKIQNFSTRMFQIVRNTFKNGDEVFIRDPETDKLYHVEVSKIRRIIVNESKGKEPEKYIIAGINFNFKTHSATSNTVNNGFITGGGSGYLTGGVRGMVGTPNQTDATNRFSLKDDESCIDAEHIVHISLSDGLDENYPFGNSLLETIFKVYKQKELLEDAIIIYRVQRAPERRVFYVDVGNMPSHLAMKFVERVKTEIHQRRIPSTTGGQHSIDSSYNPLCISLNTRIPLLDGNDYTLDEIINKFENGEKLWAYSCDPKTGKTFPGKIDWAGVTRYDTACLELTFDNGKTLICTPDHKFPVYNQGEICAKDLNSSCALFSFDSNRKSSDKTLHLTRIISKKQTKNHNTGTLTIDYDQEHHGFHNFAISAGVFIKNSINEDFFFPQTCLSLDTKIKLLDNRDLTLYEIIEEYTLGKENYTYTINQQTRELEPGKIVWAGITRTDAQVLKVTLVSGKTVICTPDHRFIMENGLEIEARDLISGNKVMPLCTHYTDMNTYQYINDCEKYSNSGIVDTVVWLTETCDTGDITIESASNSHNFALTAGIFVHNSEGRGSKVETLPGGCLAMDTLIKLSDGRHLTIAEISDEMANGKELWTYSCHPTTGYKTLGLISWAGVTQDSAQVMKIVLENGNEIICTPDHQFPVHGKGFVAAENLVEFGLIPKHSKLFNTNPSLFEKIMKEIFNITPTLNIKSIEYLDDPIQVGTLTIDNDELYHDYHTFALSAGVFTKNSSLGEISDLKYFTNKLVRGLRIPSSYLPTGEEDGSSSYNDGRVGTAYIQELRFNNYCERLQGLLVESFNKEFKRYLLEKGINIDTNMFDLTFEPPQNFASYRQAELDNSRVSTFTTMSAIPFISNRFALKRFLGLSDEEIAENETLWLEENDESVVSTGDGSDELRGAGISSAGMDADMDDMNQELPPEIDDMGDEMPTGQEDTPTQEVKT